MTIAKACDKMAKTLNEIFKPNWDKERAGIEYISTTGDPPPTIATTSTATPITTASTWTTTSWPDTPSWVTVDTTPSPSTTTIIKIPPSTTPPPDNLIATWPEQFHSEAEANIGIFALTAYISNVWGVYVYTTM